MILRIISCFLLFGFVSCGLQERLSKTQQVADAAGKSAVAEKEGLDVMNKKVNVKLQSGEIDSSVKQEYDKVLVSLNEDLRQAENKVKALEKLLDKKSNFDKKSYNANVAGYVAALDSFVILRAERERIYSLINDALSVKAFNLYNMAAFFEPGVYRIPETATSLIHQNFLPVIDSISLFANKYTNTPLVVRLVFVGYADESPVAEGSELYNDLSRFAKKMPLDRQELNRVLSELRSNEMMRNMRVVLQENTSKFKSFSDLAFNFTSYGRGEAYPNNKITDYKTSDERRRIVMFYWSVLPRIGIINDK